MTLQFTDLLQVARIDPAKTKLARHQDLRGDQTPFDLWYGNRVKFEEYQAVQSTRRFDKATHLAAFVVSPAGDTLFVGMYEVLACSDKALPTECPVSHQMMQLFRYTLRTSDQLSEYRERLLIEWTGGVRAWCQWAAKTQKPLRAVLAEPYRHAPFPGFDAFSIDRSSFAAIPSTWREVLRSSCGVYLLVHPETGEQYVGSAYGDEGFWGRFQTYADNGHGGNKLLKQHSSANWRMSVLEVASSNSDATAIIQRESHWKNKLGTRAHTLGLNAN